jgi:integrase/recombinase XerD
MKPVPVSRVARIERRDQDFLGLWLNGTSARTRRVYHRIACEFIDGISPRPLRHATLLDFQRYVDRITASSRASTVRTYLYALRSMTGFAKKLGHLRWNYAALVKVPPKDTNPNEHVLNEEQTYALLAAPRAQRHRVLLRTLYFSAGRVSEVSRLQLKDVTQHTNGGGVLWLTRKGGKRDEVWIPAPLLAQLRAITPRGASPETFVFRGQRGGQLKPSGIARIVKRYAKRAGIESNVSPHWLRHSHASHAIARGAPLPLVQRTLGHASLATTGLYVHSAMGDSSARFLG